MRYYPPLTSSLLVLMTAIDMFLLRPSTVLGFGTRSSWSPLSSVMQLPSRRLTSSALYMSKCDGVLEADDSSSNNVMSENDYVKIAKDVFAGLDQRPIVLFDGVCNLCNGGVNFALDNDATGNFRFASLQSRVGQALLVRAGKKPDDISSIVLCEPEQTYFKSDAVLRIARKLDGSIPILGFLGPIVPGFLRNIVYDFVADNRYRFGEADQCRLDDDEFNDRFVPDPSLSS